MRPWKLECLRLDESDAPGFGHERTESSLDEPGAESAA